MDIRRSRWLIGTIGVLLALALAGCGSSGGSGETGKSVSQIALNWLLQRPTVATLIVGARTEAQLLENLGAVGWSLTKEQVVKLDAASQVTLPYPYWHQRATFLGRNPPPV